MYFLPSLLGLLDAYAYGIASDDGGRKFDKLRPQVHHMWTLGPQGIFSGQIKVSVRWVPPKLCCA